MIKRYNNISLAWGIPGLIVQVGGQMAGEPAVAVLGTVLLIVGLAYYAKAKGYHPAWGLLGFLSIIEWIVLGLMKDRAKQ